MTSPLLDVVYPVSGEVEATDWRITDRPGPLRLVLGALVVSNLAVLWYLDHTTAGSHREVLAATGAAMSLFGLIGVARAGWLAGRAWREGVVLAALLVYLSITFFCAYLNGGVDSPFIYLVMPTLAYAGLGLRPRGVGWVIGSVLGGFFAVIVSDPEIRSDGATLTALTGLLATGCAVSLLFSTYRARIEGERRVLRDDLRRRATVDALTGCWNHVTFYDRLQAEIDQALSEGRPLSLAVGDVDLFQSFNDLYGHSAGDHVLRLIGEALRVNARSADFVARVGGDEFAVILPETTAPGATACLARLRDRLAGQGESMPTVSFGVAQLGGEHCTASELYRVADDALNEAKAERRGGIHEASGTAAMHEPESLSQELPAQWRAGAQRMAQRLRRAGLRLAEADAMLETLLEDAPIGVGFLDRDLRIIRINPIMARLQGDAPEHLLGRCLTDNPIWAEFEEDLAQVLEHGSVVTNLELASGVAQDSRPGGDWLIDLIPMRVEDRVIGVGMVAIDISERRQVERAQEELTEAVVAALARAEEARDPYTAGHQTRVAEIASAIARDLGIDEWTITGIRLAASVHDIGKLAVPAEILARPGRLSQAEMSVVRTHARAGYEILKDLEFPWPVAEMVLQHHERLDGSGYPDGLVAGQITQGALIIAVADVFEAMSTHRPYRSAPGPELALQVLGEGFGLQFDAEVVEACHRLYSAGRLPVCLDSLGSTAPRA